MATIPRSAYADVIVGTSLDDIIVGFDGNDRLVGGSGRRMCFRGIAIGHKRRRVCFPVGSASVIQ